MAYRKPKLTVSEAHEMLRSKGVDIQKEKFCFLAIRGYYSRSYGKPGNDRRVYDDVIAIVTRYKIYAFQANVDPSIFRYRVANLVPGVYDVVKHKHKGRYSAFQIIRDVLKRDGVAKLDTGRHGINIHYDTENISRWSLGCQTLPKSQYWWFLRKGYRLMNYFGKRTAKYCLIENA